ncbi:MAG: hypothetical protein JZD41_02110 [Thermoproteus sp.]|nr:hypothetical protein [Thermoproteus sp.]
MAFVDETKTRALWSALALVSPISGIVISRSDELKMTVLERWEKPPVYYAKISISNKRNDVYTFFTAVAYVVVSPSAPMDGVYAIGTDEGSEVVVVDGMNVDYFTFKGKPEDVLAHCDRPMCVRIKTYIGS